jgi:hypothetical protein
MACLSVSPWHWGARHLQDDDVAVYWCAMKVIPTLKQGLVLFWALWSTLVFASNLGDGLKELGLLPVAFAYASGNFGAITEVAQLFGTPIVFAALMFAGVLLWDGLNTVLFWRAVRHSARIRLGDYARADIAFAASLGLWGALMVADELFLTYRVAAFEQTHRGIFVAMLVSLLAVRLLPND